MAQDLLHAQCMALDWKELLWLYGDLLGDAPEHCIVPARALRDLARSGKLPEAAIPLLVTCLVDAQGPGTLSFLAKTLAAFGRRAGMAAPYLMEHIHALLIVDDESFWAFDGCLFALGYLGSPEDAALLDELASRRPCPVSRAGDVYRGEISGADREKIFAETLEQVRELLLDEQHGAWRQKMTDRQAVELETARSISPWMTR